MTPAPAGFLLPQSTLTEPWFLVMTTVVAFNTIIYVGLTLAKLIPWPRQFHPSQVRALLGRFVPSQEGPIPMADIPNPERLESPDPYEDLRRRIARGDTPQAFALVGGLIVLLGFATYFTYADRSGFEPIAELLMGLLYLVISQVLGRRPFHGRTMMWTWAACSVLLVGLLLTEAWVHNSVVPIAYALVVMTAYPPITLAWRPSLSAAAAMLAGTLLVSLKIPGSEDGRLVIAAIAAMLVGFVLLRLRLSAIDEISDEQSRSMALATTDALTGTLTRQGFLTLLPGLASTATRSGQEICVMMFDVDELSRANAEYGVLYGDDVLGAVASAIKSTVRQGDLVARWGGDEFLVAGLGSQPSADHLAHRIQEAVRISGINLGKWPTQVTVLTAAGDPAVVTFDELLTRTTIGA